MINITNIIYNNPTKIKGLSLEFKSDFGSEKIVEELFLSNKDENNFLQRIKNKLNG
jgi:hypothetical protein